MCNRSCSGCGCCLCASIADALKNLFALDGCCKCSCKCRCTCTCRAQEQCLRGGFGACASQNCCSEAYYARQYGMANADCCN